MGGGALLEDKERGRDRTRFPNGGASAICIRCDSTEFRLRPKDHHVSTEEVFARRLELYGEDSACFKLIPSFSRMRPKKYGGIFSCLD